MISIIWGAGAFAPSESCWRINAAWSGANGASGERAHDVVRHQHRRDDSAKVDQSQGAQRGHSRFLWSLTAFPIHGSDESAGGADPQASAFGAGTRRSLARSCRVRSARRSSLTLRTDLPDRDAGRAEHWINQLDVDLCPNQRIWVYRNALSQGS